MDNDEVVPGAANAKRLTTRWSHAMPEPRKYNRLLDPSATREEVQKKEHMRFSWTSSLALLHELAPSQIVLLVKA